MAVYSNTFGGLRLTGDDARKFRNQTTYGRPGKGAQEAARRGNGLAASLLRDGFVKVRIPFGTSQGASA